MVGVGLSTPDVSMRAGTNTHRGNAHTTRTLSSSPPTLAPSSPVALMIAASTTSTAVASYVVSSIRAALKHIEDLRTDVSHRVRAAIIGAVTFLRARCPARAHVSLRTTALVLGVGEGVLRRRVRKAEGVTASEGSLLFEWQRGLRSDQGCVFQAVVCIKRKRQQRCILRW